MSITAIGLGAGRSRGEPAATSPPGATLTFEADIRPILKAHCFYCHGEDESIEAGVDLRQVRRMLDSYTIDDVDPHLSLLLDVVETGEMPKDGKPLPAEDVETIRRWLAQGFPTARPEPEELPDFYITPEEQAHWAFRPIVKPAVPRGGLTHPVDAFVGVQLRSRGLDFAPPADRVTLIRRATFDLHGLPPTPEMVNQFVRDDQPGAWERAINRLLGDQAYGERWGRHWLDVVGYADSAGSLQDQPRENAWQYRDYVVRAHNEDRPWDQFLLEQLAGDELVGLDHDAAAKGLPDPSSWDSLAATGFWRMPPDGTADKGADQDVSREEVLTDTLRVFGNAFLGLTVQCAQCHDHRFDPISHSDYYRLRALIEPVYDVRDWRKPKNRLYDAYTVEEMAANAVIEAKAEAVDQARQDLIDAEYDKYLRERMKGLEEPIQDQIWVAWHLDSKERTDEQAALLEKHDCDFKKNSHLRSIPDRKKQEAQRVAYLEQAERIRLTKLSRTFMAATEEAGEIPPTRRYHRGSPAMPKEVVPPGDLTIVENRPKIPVDDQSLPTSGRRLAYARWLTSGEHPLLTRVLANRFWLHHFGNGFVDHSDDFGMRTPRPVHADLLDYLAATFAQEGWSLKSLHRLIMTSQTYRQSTRNDDAQAVDPGNRLLARMSMQRLEAEAVRDSMLSVSGQLVRHLGGRPVAVARNPAGGIVLGKELSNANNGVVHTVEPFGEASRRRSLYVQQMRSRTLSVLSAFDMPNMAPNCSQRVCSTVAPQSLMMLNDQFVIDQSRQLAQRLISEHPDSPDDQVEQLWRLAYGEAPDEQEGEVAAAMLSRAVDRQAAIQSDGTPQQRALASLCQVIFATNRFLYAP